MKSVTLFAAIAFTAVAGAAHAQTTSTGTGTGTGTGTTTGTTSTGVATNAPTPATDHNAAVATTTGDAPAPAKGANSFTHKQAARRIAHPGFTQVKDLTKDDNGVWHGTAMKDGGPVKVWEDYKGSVGTE